MENQLDKSASHGPTSPEGKAIASRNAIKHGGCATGTLILSTESHEDFLALESRWFKAYRVRPDHADDAYEAELIRDAVRTEWFSLRAERNYAETEAQIMDETPNPLQWNDRQHHAIQRFMRYKTANANALIKSRKALEDYRKARIAERAAQQNSLQKEQKLSIAETKLEIHKRKSCPEPSYQELLEEMKQQAIRMGYLDPKNR